MKRIILGFFILVVTGMGTNAHTLTGTQSADSVKLLASNCYNLQGCYVVPSGKVLTIEAGTVIRCEAASNLVVERGGVIVAEGTATDNIVFTSDQAIGHRNPGDWGGVALLGNAENNESTSEITKICTNRLFGGTTINDNSGILKYVRIEYAGDVTNRDEATALLLASIGKDTKVEHIQITESAANAITLMGGDVAIKTAYILNAYQNDLFLNLGYTGEISGVLTMRQDPAAHHTAGSNGMLVWNNKDHPTNTPLTKPTVLNCSFIGPEHCNSGSLSSDFKDGVSFDHNGGGDFYNNVITGFKGYALYINDAQSASRTANDELDFSYNSMTNNGSGDYSYNSIAINPWNGCSTTMDYWIKGTTSVGCEESDNQFSSFVLGYDASFCDDYCEANFEPNFVLNSSSTRLDDPSSISLLDYRGAVQKDNLFTWVIVCPQDTAYCTPEMEKVLKENKSSLIIVPNPAQSQANLMFDANALGNGSVLIFDKVTGRVLFQKNIIIKHVGEQKVSIPLKGLREGVYPIRVQMKNSVINSLISVQ